MTAVGRLACIYPRLTVDADGPFLADVQAGIQKEVEVIGELQEIASKHPYYK